MKRKIYNGCGDEAVNRGRREGERVGGRTRRNKEEQVEERCETVLPAPRCHCEDSQTWPVMR